MKSASSTTPGDVTAAILAGGLGTRLRPAVQETPKVLAAVGGRPFLTILLDQLACAGVRETVLLTGHRADDVRLAVGTRHGTMRLAYSHEPSPLGTAGALRHALALLSSPTVLLLNGDSYCDVDLAHLLTAHQETQADLTVTLTHAADTSPFGRVLTTAEERITGFVEKLAEGGPGWINAGIYVVARSLVAAIPQGRHQSLERDLIPEWLRTHRLYGYRGASRFLDIGTPASYARAPAFFQELAHAAT